MTRLGRSVQAIGHPEAALITDEPLLDRLIGIDEVCTLVGIGRSTCYKWIADPEIGFPRPVRLGRRASRWWLSAVLQWARDRPTT